LRHELGGLKNASEIQQLKHDLNAYATSIQTQLAQHSQNRDQVILDDNRRLQEQTVKIIQEAVAAAAKTQPGGSGDDGKKGEKGDAAAAAGGSDGDDEKMEEDESPQNDAKYKGKRSSSNAGGDRNDREQTQVFEEEEPEKEEPKEKSKDDSDSDDFADGLVYFKNNPNVTMCQGRWGHIKKMRHNTCIGRFLSQPKGTMHNVIKCLFSNKIHDAA